MPAYANTCSQGRSCYHTLGTVRMCLPSVLSLVLVKRQVCHTALMDMSLFLPGMLLNPCICTQVFLRLQGPQGDPVDGQNVQGVKAPKEALRQCQNLQELLTQRAPLAHRSCLLLSPKWHSLPPGTICPLSSPTEVTYHIYSFSLGPDLFSSGSHRWPLSNMGAIRSRA